MKKPLIGIVLDSEEKGDYSQYPYYVLREHYFDAVIKAGGIPVALVHSPHIIDEYLYTIDGLLLTGGDFDIPPSMYGEESVHETVVIKPSRTQFEFELVTKALEQDLPILGICAGEQLLAVIHGGTLIQDINSEIENCLNHYNDDREATAHEITIVKDTLLHSIIGHTVLGVNSHHHQAVKNISDRLIVSARSSDGVIEAIEVKDKAFCLGVQWHPEYINSSSELSIFRAFIEACNAYTKKPID